MAQLTSKQKREWARMLYVKENLTQKEIAEKVGSSRQSVNKWISEGKWEELKAGLTLTKEEQIKNLYRQVGELNRAILEREDGQRFASASEADTIGKLSAAIRKMESDTGIADMISVGIKFLEWMRKADSDRAREFAEYWDMFIKDQM
ncbi:MAG: helix-turn-helix domain-containing protein [Bacteroidales bacterium]|nr:helix-turn-helix domain-containing protein [Candidatus Cryptobacteroides equifaecalis]